MRLLKKTCAVLLALMMICFCPASFSAAETYITLYGFAFDVNDDGMAVIHSYDNRQPAMDIPNALMGYPVAVIDDFAFFNNTGITSVSFEKTTQLKRIGSNAFNGCSGITEVTIPGTVEELGSGAFQYCTGMTDLVIEEGLQTIPDQAFFGCSALARVYLPDSVTSIAENAFKGCDAPVIYGTKDSYAVAYAIANDKDYYITDVETIRYILGDADGDELISILDATRIQRVLAKLVFDDDGMVSLRGDINGNGLDIMDATGIQRHLANFSDATDIGKRRTIFV